MVLIIGILAAIAVPQYNQAVLRSRGTEALIHARSLKNAIDAWRLQNGDTSATSRPTFQDLDIELPNLTYTTDYNAKGKYWDYDLRPTNFCIRSYMGTVKQPVVYEICPNSNSSLIQCLAGVNDSAGKSMCLYLGGTFTQTSNGMDYYTIAK